MKVLDDKTFDGIQSDENIATSDIPVNRPLRRPEWLKVRLKTEGGFQDLKGILRGEGLHTVCEEAKCPNLYECWAHRTATFMILGNVCTRACRFCAVTPGKPSDVDLLEPQRVADAVIKMQLRHAVVTAVARDDLLDGGASVFAATIDAIRRASLECKVEVLIPDFMGDRDALEVVMNANPDILNHNVETVRRLSDRVRSKAKYDRSLELLSRALAMKPDIPTKSSIMLGVGETWEEILETMNDLRAVGVSIITIGQYLQPTRRHLPVSKYYTPDEFSALRKEGKARGFKHVESGPLVRSSYHAHEQAQGAARG